MLPVRGQEILTAPAVTSLCFYTLRHISLHQYSQNKFFIIVTVVS